MSTALVVCDEAPAPLAYATPWQDVLEVFLQSKDSPSTRREYRRAITQALELFGVATLAEITGADLAGFRGIITRCVSDKTGAALAPATQAQMLSALRSFLRWAGALGAHGLPMPVIEQLLKTPKGSTLKPYNTVSEPEIASLLMTAENPRDRAILAVMLGAGLRVSELVALDVAHVNENGEGGAVLFVRQGKGRKDREVPVQPEVLRCIRAYLASTGRSLAQPGPLFRAHDAGAGKRDRKRLTARAVGYLVAKYTTAAGIDAKRVSPHSMRHTYAIRSLRAGGSVVAVQKLLGHSSVTVTSRYLDHLKLAELREAVPSLPMPEGA